MAFLTTNPTIGDGTGIRMDSLTKIEETVIITGLDEIRYALEIDDVLKWHNGTEWGTADASFAQTNTLAGINANASTLPIAEGGSTVRAVAFLHSFDGTTTPELEALRFTYDPAIPEEPDEPRRCNVTGFNIGVREGTVVRAIYPDVGFVHGDHFIPDGAVFRTRVDANGNFELLIPETETVNQKVTIEVLAIVRGKLETRTIANVTIPNQDQADLNSLI